jgi:pyruvate/2-oxoglutarate dehydrogenase complex dihydrolipoamide acyltransferase (E2) component
VNVEVRSPIDGIVTDMFAHDGDEVAVGNPFFIISSASEGGARHSSPAPAKTTEIAFAPPFASKKAERTSEPEAPAAPVKKPQPAATPPKESKNESKTESKPATSSPASSSGKHCCDL